MNFENFVSACEVYWGEYSSEVLELEHSRFLDPETELIKKEQLALLSPSAKEMIDITLNLPERFYKKNGRVSVEKLREFFRKELKWKRKLILNTMAEIKYFVEQAI